MSVENSANQIIDEIGGIDNIVSVTHCATRLRFTLKDTSSIDKNKIDKIEGVMAGVPQGDAAYQIVIGGAVAQYCDAIETIISNSNKGGGSKTNIKNDTRTADEVKADARSKRGKHKIDAFFEYLSDSFRPIIGVLLAASLVVAGLNLCISFGIISSDTANPTAMFFKAIGQGVFYFLPIMIAYNASKKLKVDPWVGALVMMVIMTPQFLALGTPDAYSSVFGNSDEADIAKSVISTITNDSLGDKGTFVFTRVLGLPLMIYSYAGNVFVPLLMAPILALVYNFFKKIIPTSVQLVFVPFFSVVIMVFLTAFIIGPIGVMLGSYIGIGLSWLNTNAPFIFMIVIPILYPFLVPLGLHWPLNALMLINISTLGYDFIQAPMGCWNFACFGTTFGILLISIREKDVQMRTVSAGALTAGLLGGVSEPSLYGIHLRYKKTYWSLLPGCVAGGLTIAVLSLFFPSSVGTGVTADTFVFTSLFSIPVFDQMWVFVVSIVVAFTVSAVCVQVMDYRTDEEKIFSRALSASTRLGITSPESILDPDLVSKYNATKKAKKNMKKALFELLAPIDGKVISLKETTDKAFAIFALGKGAAIIPKKKKSVVKCPISGYVQEVAEAKHAYTITNKKNNISILIHVGIDTVYLEGKHFKSLVEEGQDVQPGDDLCEADFAAISDEGYKIPVVMTVINTYEMDEVELSVDKGSDVKENTKMIKISKSE